MMGCSFLISGVVRRSPDKGPEEQDTFNHPLVIAWLCTSVFMFYLPLRAVLKRVKHAPTAGEEREPLLGEDDSESLELGVGETWRKAAPFSVLWFATNACIDAALSLTSVSSMTLCFSTAGLWTLLIGAAFGIEELTLGKLAASLLTITGVALVCKGDALNASEGTMYGNVLAMTAALGYASFLVYYRVRLAGEKVSLMLFFGLVGATSFLFFTPIVLLLEYRHGIHIPRNPRLLLCLAGDVWFSFAADYLNVKAMMQTSALVATLATTMTVPLAILGDFVLGTQLGGWRSGLGAVVIVISFLFTTVKESLR